MDTTEGNTGISLGLIMFGVGPSPPLVDFTSEVSGDDELRLVVSAGGFDGAFVSIEGIEGEGVVESREYNRGDVVVVDRSDVIQPASGVDTVQVVWERNGVRTVLYSIPV